MKALQAGILVLGLIATVLSGGIIALSISGGDYLAAIRIMAGVSALCAAVASGLAARTIILQRTEKHSEK